MGFKLNLSEWYISKFSSSLYASSGKLTLRKNDSDYYSPDFSYLCPLCLKSSIVYLPEEMKTFWNYDFDYDHFPPQSIGGKETVLICKSCNSTSDSKYDFTIKEFLKHDVWIKRNSKAKIKIKMHLNKRTRG